MTQNWNSCFEAKDGGFLKRALNSGENRKRFYEGSRKAVFILGLGGFFFFFPLPLCNAEYLRGFLKERGGFKEEGDTVGI